jgi:hypothetical protein
VKILKQTIYAGRLYTTMFVKTRDIKITWLHRNYIHDTARQLVFIKFFLCQQLVLSARVINHRVTNPRVINPRVTNHSPVMVSVNNIQANNAG